jgi:hypothetical protein
MNLEQEPADVLKQYLKIATSYSRPLFWGSFDAGIHYNGTAFVLDTGSRTFVVTAAHVYRKYMEQKRLGQVDFCQLSDLNFDMEERLISIPTNEAIDIATFDIGEKEVSRLKGEVLRGSNNTWPPPRPIVENMVVVSGFPGLERLRKEDDHYSFGYYCFNTPVSSISNRHFVCSIDRTYWIDALGKGLPPDNYNMGGISGAPAIALIKSEAGIVSWRLAGIVYEAGTSLGEVMFVMHADFVEADGKVKEYA